MKHLCLLLTTFLLTISVNVMATQDVHHFDDKADKDLYLELIEDLRCPKCQNQNIADSNANIAKDLRAKVFKLVNEGKDKNEVVDYMVERYGYFVYYKPPFNAATMILWLLPLGFVFLTLAFIWRKSQLSLSQQDDGEWTDEQEQQLSALIAQIEQGVEQGSKAK